MPDRAPGPTPAEPTVASLEWVVELLRADRACCCSARPAVVAVLPPTGDRPHRVELLLCGHHHRLLRHSLAASGAIFFDRAGEPLTVRDDPFATL